LRIDLQTLDETAETALGTSAILRHFAHRIPYSFILLPCDFIPPKSLSLTSVINKFRLESATDGAVATTLWFERPVAEKSSGTEEWEGQPAPPAIAWDAQNGTLLYIDTEEDVDRDDEDFEFRRSLLARYQLYLTKHPGLMFPN
jgi:translation initiation factor eIF-2B subunit gamma